MWNVSNLTHMPNRTYTLPPSSLVTNYEYSSRVYCCVHRQIQEVSDDEALSIKSIKIDILTNTLFTVCPSLAAHSSHYDTASLHCLRSVLSFLCLLFVL